MYKFYHKAVLVIRYIIKFLSIGKSNPKRSNLAYLKFLGLSVLLLQVQITSNAQGITINKKSASLSEIFKEIRKQTDYDFVYSDKQLATTKTVTISLAKASVKDVLDKCFENQPISYRIRDKTITIETKSLTPLENKRIPLSVMDIRGMVIDEAGVPLSGAGISIKDINKVTITDSRGEFFLKGVNEDAILVVSYIGYATQEIPVKTDMGKILLLRSKDELNEVQIVSTGYQNISKERANGSFVHVNQQQLERIQSTTIIDRLRDIVPGLTFNTRGNSSLSIRGQSTIFANAEPLIVLDNFPYDGNLNSINPNDIESITVLRDAAAASIWGSRAGNGVIVITSKKAQKNSITKISASTATTLTDKPNLFYFKTLSSPNAIEVEQLLFNKGFYTVTENSLNKTGISPAVELMIAKRDGKIDQQTLDAKLAILSTEDVRNDGAKYMYQLGSLQQHSLNISGGNNNHGYYLSSGYDFNKSTNIGNSYERMSINFRNTNTFLKQKLELGTAITYTHNRTQNRNSGLSGLRMTATIPIYPYASLVDEQGNPIPITKDIRTAVAASASQNGLLDWQYNPIAELDLPGRDDKSVDQRMQVDLKYVLPFGLSASTLFLYGKNDANNQTLRTLESYYTRNEINRITKINADGSITQPVPLGDILDKENASVQSLNFRGQLNMDRSWGIHHLTAIAGYERRSVTGSSDLRRLYGYDSEHETYKIVNYGTTYPLYLNPASTTNVITNIDQLAGTTDHFLSYYTNLGYSFKNKYVLNASARKDESNLFGVNANQKGVPLYSVGLGWIVTGEDFFKNGKIDYLKLKGSFGYNGNIDKSLSAFTTATYFSGSTARQLTRLPYAAVNNPPNPDLRWERVKIYNVGLDFVALSNKISGALEFYRKDGVDLIGNTIYPPSSGISSFRGNFANTRTHGIDFNLNIEWFFQKQDRGFGWKTAAIFSTLNEKVTAYFVQSSVASTVTSQSATQVVGKPLFALYSYPSAGLDPVNGDPRAYNGGIATKDYTKILATTNWDDIKYHGSARPTAFGAIRNDISYRNVSLSFNMNYKLGYYFRRQSVNYNSLLTGAYGGNFGNEYAQRWKIPGDEMLTIVPSIPAVSNTNRDRVFEFSDALVEKGDHLRLQDVRLAYRFLNGIKRIGINRLEVFTYLNNGPILWRANDSGLDPDNYATLPQVKNYSMGLKLEL